MGAANLEDDGGYAGKVLAEHERLRQVAAGRAVPALPGRGQPLPIVTPAKPDAASQKVAQLSES